MSPEWVAAYAAIVTILGSVLVGMAGGGYWLRSQFAANREHTSREVGKTWDRLDKLEEETDKRHLENIGQIHEIELRLARMGNGSGEN